jgi:hypothetical protein
MDPTTITTVLESILFVGMVKPAAAMASVPSLAAAEVTVPDERGGKDGETVSRQGPSPLDFAPE